jgi:hypothetical protein
MATSIGNRTTPETANLSKEEKRSLTHGEFWIPEAERSVYQAAMRALNAAGVRYVVSGLYAIYEYTGIYRETKDLDLLLEPETAVRAAAVLKEHGFRTHRKQPHWLGKAFHGEFFDLDDALIVPPPAEPIPIIVGGRSNAAVRRAGRLGDPRRGQAAAAPLHHPSAAVGLMIQLLDGKPLDRHGSQ